MKDISIEMAKDNVSFNSAQEHVNKSHVRIESVECCRVFAIIAIIVLHTEPFRYGYEDNFHHQYAFIILNQLARFAVPFFFVISGYFWGIKVQYGLGKAYTLLTVKRLVLLFLIWSFIYLIPYDVNMIFDYGLLGPIKKSYWCIMALISDPGKLLFQGTKVHLWFLMGLVSSLIIAYIFVRKGYERSLILFSLALYLIGILTKSYSESIFGIQTDFNTRNGPFFGTIFFVTGYFFTEYKPNPSWIYPGSVLLACGYVIHFSEIYILWFFFKINPIHDFVIGTYLIGIGYSMVALSNHRILINKQISKIGKYILGIYLLHFIFVDLTNPFIHYIRNPFGEVLCVVMVFLLSYVTAWYMYNNKYLSKVIL